MKIDPLDLDVIDTSLSNIRNEVRRRIAERLEHGASIVSVSQGKVISKAKVDGRIEERVIGRVRRSRSDKAQQTQRVRIRVGQAEFVEDPAAAI